MDTAVFNLTNDIDEEIPYYIILIFVFNLKNRIN